ncbi:MAG: hypothetical protein HYV33_01100 [Candidatus Kerfeldbacteria bacterium]|nr:hypothetical protein [Candidatus Kerfeldbacteria bacterium]
MKVKNSHLIGSSLAAMIMAVVTTSLVSTVESGRAAEETVTANSTVFGALYEVAHLEASVGANTESVLGFIPDQAGFFAYTTNSDSAELWVAEDALGLEWAQADTNPLAEHTCGQIGRHTMLMYNNATYFAANCEDGNHVFQQTDLTSATIVHTNLTEDSNDQQPTAAIQEGEPLPPPPDQQNPDQPDQGNNMNTSYPTAAVVGTEDNQQLVMFFTGGVSLWDGTTWSDRTDLPGQPTGVPLEASQPDPNGLIYLAFTSGEVMSFDGATYVTIGEGYLEDISGEQTMGYNLPAVAVFNNHVYVGNQDVDNGASVFAYDLAATEPTWEEIVQLESSDEIINKMTLSHTFGTDRQYLALFTSNGEFGTRTLALNTDNELMQLIDSGLGGGADEREVVSVANRTITDNGKNKKVLLFGTQNSTDQSRIYVLHLDEQLPIEPTEETTILSAPKTNAVLSLFASKTKTVTAKGEVFRLKVSSKSISKGDQLILYINDKEVDRIKVKDVAAAVLKYKGARKLKVGDTFTVSLGRRAAYGTAAEQQLASNIVEGSTMKVKVKK